MRIKSFGAAERNRGGPKRAQLLLERLKGKVRVDFGTARRLFTLICVLHWKG